MFVRTGDERDLAAVSRLIVQTAHAGFDALYGAEAVENFCAARFSIDQLTRSVRRERSEFLVADDGETLGGLAYGAAAGDDARIVDLDMLIVRPDLQGRGIGGMLLEEFESSFFESELVRMDLDEKNTRAVRFYTDAGFVEIGRKDGTNLPAVILTMQKSLV